MKNCILILVFGFTFRMWGFAQTTAQDWTKNDCDGNATHLFDLLDHGTVVIMDFVHVGCVPCIIGTTYLDQIYKDYAISHPGRVKMFCMSYDNVATCTDMQSWGTTNSFNEPKYINNASDVAYYGGMGMPTVVVTGGIGHEVFFRKLGINSSDDPVIRAAVDQALLAPVSSDPAPQKSVKFSFDYTSAQIRIAGLNRNATLPVRLVTVDGRQIMEENVMTDGGITVVQLPSLASGLYCIRINDAGSTHSWKFFVP